MACGLLVTLYFPTVFTVASILLALFAFHPRRGVLAGCSALLTIGVVLLTTLHGDLSTYSHFIHELLFAKGTWKTFFTARQAFSPHILAGRLFLLVYSGAALTTALIIVLLWGGRHSGFRLDARKVLLFLMGGFHLFFFLFGDPKLGMRQDFDLYWPFYLTLPLIAGWLLQTRADTWPREKALRYQKLAASACLGFMLAHLFVLRLAGLPPAP
ncbi:MAG: hypothetical protein U1F87_05920 [Kiritimatiellia bacterium]